MRPSRLPNPLRLAVYAIAVAVLLWLCLAPNDRLPEPPDLSDKVEHAVAWFVLAALGVAFWPRRWRTIGLFALSLGVAVELLQASMGFGRDADWRDVIADLTGVMLALGIAALLRPRRLDPA